MLLPALPSTIRKSEFKSDDDVIVVTGIVIVIGRTVTALDMAARSRVMWNLDDTSIARPIR